MLPAKLVEPGASGTTVALPSGQRMSVPVDAGSARPGDSVTLGIRPEGLRIEAAGPISAAVYLVERLGGLTHLHVKAEGDLDMTVQIEGSDPVRTHEQIRLAIDPAACHLFENSGQALPHLDRHPLAA
jgi:multiple sugar transport system ATP-binding protein